MLAAVYELFYELGISRVEGPQVTQRTLTGRRAQFDLLPLPAFQLTAAVAAAGCQRVDA